MSVQEYSDGVADVGCKNAAQEQVAADLEGTEGEVSGTVWKEDVVLIE